jgi:hypothetical protein
MVAAVRAEGAAPAEAVAPIAGAAQPRIDPKKIPELIEPGPERRGAHVSTIPIVEAQAQANPIVRLCLAYSEFNIKDAINKYIRKDIDFNVAAGDGYDPLDAMEDVKKIDTLNILSIYVNSLVFNQEIFSELIIRFTHLPRGNQFILRAAQYMRPIMRRICYLIDAGQRATIGASMDMVSSFYPYQPTPHDFSKFTMLDDGMRNAWLQYLINKIFGAGGVDPQTIFDNMKLFVLLYNYIGPVGAFPDTPPVINYLDVVGPLIDEHYAGCKTKDVNLLLRTMSWESEEPRVVAAFDIASADAAARAAAARVPAGRAAGINAKDKQLARVAPKSASFLTPIDSRLAEITKKHKSSSTAKLDLNRVKAGGNKPNNHTRRNKNKRKKNSKTKTKTKAKSSPKYKKRIPSSRSGSQSNRKKYKPTKSQKNVTFKRRRARK